MEKSNVFSNDEIIRCTVCGKDLMEDIKMSMVQIITDENDEPIDDIDDIVGSDFAEHFGEYEDDSVFIRNDRLQCDYEILRDDRNYADIAE